MKYIVKDIIDLDTALVRKDANKLYNELYNVISKNILSSKEEKIEVSFKGIEYIGILFCQNSIGKLFEVFPTDYLFRNLKIIDVNNTENMQNIILAVKLVFDK